MTEDKNKELSESGIQTSSINLVTTEIQTDNISIGKSLNFIEFLKDISENSEEKQELSTEETKIEISPVQNEDLEGEVDDKDSIIDRIDNLEKEYSENGVQTSTKIIDEIEYQKLISELENKKSEFLSQTEKLTEALTNLKIQNKAINVKDQTLHEQMEEIEQLSMKIKDLENTLSEENDVKESQKDILEKQEENIILLKTQLEEQEQLVNDHAEKLVGVEKDLKSKEEQYMEKNEEFSKLTGKFEEVSKKYSSAKLEYAKIYKENEKLIEKCATLHMEKDELTQKNHKYKKQLLYLQEEQSKKIEKLKEQKLNNEMEIIKYQSLLKEKENFLDKLLHKDLNNSSEIRMIVEESYKKITDYEKSIIEQDHQRVLNEQKEKLEKVMKHL